MESSLWLPNGEWTGKGQEWQQEWLGGHGRTRGDGGGLHQVEVEIEGDICKGGKIVRIGSEEKEVSGVICRVGLVLGGGSIC